MATLLPGLYNRYEFNKVEEPVAQQFNHLQKMYLENLRYEAMLQRDELVPDFKCPEDYFYRKAQIDGQIQVLTFLIDLEPEVSEVDNQQ